MVNTTFKHDGSPVSSIKAQAFINDFERIHKINSKYLSKIAYYYIYKTRSFIFIRVTTDKQTCYNTNQNGIENNKTIKYLDLTIINSNNSRKISIFRKPTKSISHTLTAFVNSQMKNSTDEEQRLKTIIKYMAADNGYSLKIIDKFNLTIIK